jgi:hypothetical protein
LAASARALAARLAPTQVGVMLGHGRAILI